MKEDEDEEDVSGKCGPGALRVSMAKKAGKEV